MRQVVSFVLRYLSSTGDITLRRPLAVGMEERRYVAALIGRERTPQRLRRGCLRTKGIPAIIWS